MKKAPGYLVHVEWRDSCSPSRKWQDEDIGRTYQSTVCNSVGWLLRRDNKNIVLAASYADSEVGDVTAIPASCVVKVRRLK